MQRLWLIIILSLLIVVTIILIKKKNKSKLNKVSSSQKFGLSSSVGSTDFANNNEAIKMTFPLVLKNTIMSLKPLETNNPSNIYYPSIIREGLFYIKSGNSFIWKNSFGGLELRDTPPVINDFSTKYQSGILENGAEQPVPFFLKFKEKDENKREYTFYVKSFLGDIGNENSFKNIGIKPFWQAGYNNLTAKFDYGCNEGSDEGGFTMSIPVNQKNLGYTSYPDNKNFVKHEISWYRMPPAIKGVGYWGYGSPYTDGLSPNTTKWLCGQHENDRWGDMVIEYEQPERPSLAITDMTIDDSSCEFNFIYDENGKLHLKKDNKYLHFWYFKFPTLVDTYNDSHSIELVPVLNSGDGNLAERYYKASMKFLDSPDGKPALINFCDYNGDTFKDGTKKIYDNPDHTPSTDIVERAFGSICDCNMSRSFYVSRLCPEELIIRRYGLNPNSPTYEQDLKNIRDTLRCVYPNCSAAKCVKWGTLTSRGEISDKDFIDAKRDKREGGCGSTTLCITNQNLNLGEGAVLEGNVLNFATTTECGGTGSGNSLTTEESGNFIVSDDGKSLKKNVICKINNNVVTPADNPECKSDITYMKFEGSACKIITDSQTGKKIIVKNISSQKTDNINWDDIKVNQLDFIKTNINSIPNCS